MALFILTTMIMPTGGTLFEHFKTIDDPRVDRTKLHNLIDIIIIAICAVIGGADSWVGIEDFGKSKEGWFRKFLELPHGIPTHDTFGRIFARIYPEQFEKGFQSWVTTIAHLTSGMVVAIDGKTVRRSHDRVHDLAALHVVSAFATANNLALGQRVIDTKSNELKAIPKLLDLLDIVGCIVTIDAAGCYPEIVQKIAENQADYLIAVKKNQPTLYVGIEQLLEPDRHAHDDYARHEETRHGRSELRECFVITNRQSLTGLARKNAWKNLNSVIKIRSTRTIRAHVTTETRYYISSLATGDAEQALTATRQHWGIENSLHWILDIAFREDESRIRAGHAQENFTILRKIALNLLKQETTSKVGVKNKRLKAGWDEPYLLKVLGI